MRTLSDTIARLAAAQPHAAPANATGRDRLVDMLVTGFNPGQLRARIYLPESLRPGAPLVVVLHGCTQTAAGYDHGSGWSTLADRYGFALLYPEQQRANNANLCFNWFVPDDIRRDGGEVLSIRHMIEQMIADHDLDPARVFVTGLSAGGAMTAVMLATWPEVFAGGAIVAGLPFASARTMPQAFDRMRGHGGAGGEELAGRVREASSHQGPWPILSVWHGTADHTVAASNMEAIVDQWRLLQGIDETPAHTESLGGHHRRVWSDAHGNARIEAHAIDGMGHGTPIAPGATGCGMAGPYMLDVGVSSTQHIAAFWGIADAPVADRVAPRAAVAEASPAAPRVAQPKPLRLPARPRPMAPVEAGGVKKVIEDALRAAGLMR
uniref:extracellular catalytic domain type 1 short-chain-length polyhydroxyalkanoate depolymerase n=1 Tax=Sphingomonas bacterium TaxID=1895847 RepID=UPI00262C6ACF|nr:PHB depolymerase family esterase [Sphingomonas bacterium]